MIVGAIVGLLLLALLSIGVSCLPGIRAFQPYPHIWVLFGTVGALVGSLF